MIRLYLLHFLKEKQLEKVGKIGLILYPEMQKKELYFGLKFAVKNHSLAAMALLILLKPVLKLKNVSLPLIHAEILIQSLGLDGIVSNLDSARDRVAA